MDIYVLKSVGAVIVIGAEGMIRDDGTRVHADNTATRYSVARIPDEKFAKYCKQRGVITAQCECSGLSEAISTLCTPEEIALSKIVTEERPS